MARRVWIEPSKIVQALERIRPGQQTHSGHQVRFGHESDTIEPPKRVFARWRRGFWANSILRASIPTASLLFQPTLLGGALRATVAQESFHLRPLLGRQARGPMRVARRAPWS